MIGTVEGQGTGKSEEQGTGRSEGQGSGRPEAGSPTPAEARDWMACVWFPPFSPGFNISIRLEASQ